MSLLDAVRERRDPVGQISSRGVDGTEIIAPCPFFNAVADEPPQVMFVSTGAKADQEDSRDSVANIRRTGVFCVNIVEYAMRIQMNETSGNHGTDVNEFEHAGLASAPCETIPISRVEGTPARLECRLRGETNALVHGEVAGTHLRDDCLSDGCFDVRKCQPLARLGCRDNARITELFEMTRPSD